MSLILDIAELPAEEIGPVMEILLAAEDVNWTVAESLAVRWGMLDPKAALAFAIGREGLGDDYKVMPPIVQELTKVDLPAAKAALAHLDAGNVRENVRKEIVRVLLHDDPRAALAYVRELKDEDAETEALKFMAQKEPLVVAAELIPGRAGHLEVVASIAVSPMEKDRAAFEAWAGSLRDPAQRAVARGTALRHDADDDPAKVAMDTAAWLAKEPEASEQADRLPLQLAKLWMDKGGPPPEVAAWATALPEGPARDSAVETLPPRRDALREAVRKWARRDADAAEQALETLPASDRVYLRDILEAAKEEREKAQEQK